MWIADEIAESAAHALSQRESALRAEQAVYGLDALGEVELHPILAHGFRSRGLGVLRECPFPGAGGTPKQSHRERCDLVLLPPGQTTLLDPVALARERRTLAGTLFEHSASTPGPAPDQPTGALPGDAYWLEVKCVAQNSFVQGIPAPNPAFGGQLTASLAADLRKLSREIERGREHGDGIARAGVLLVLLTRDEPTARHDLAEALHRCLDRGISPRSATTHGFAILDRIGNAWCAATLVEA
jgi:hypothetical protein